MTSILNCTILKLIYESANSLVYRAVRNDDQQPVILKILKADSPTPAKVSRYQHEYDLLRQVQLPGIIRVYHLETAYQVPILILEDFGGESLKYWLQQRSFAVREGLTLAIQLTDSLGHLHAVQVIHKDLNPSNLIWQPQTACLKIIDFGIATRLPRELTTLKSPTQLEGTLAYLSPEQTGRMNRALDYRTDLYSLGVTLYELFTGHLPFDSQDAMELVHCHLAKLPVPPHQVKAGLPPVISNLILRLLAKNAEARYQSAWGVKADLVSILERLDHWDEFHGINFDLGQQDFADHFCLPQKLYGRDMELATLLASFENVAQGHSELLLVAGYSGIGKTSLVQEIYKPITERQGYFISGKFDQFQRNIPYSALVSALSDLVHQLATETEERLSQWRQELLVALGDNGQVIVEVIPELEWIIGKQSAVPNLAPTEAQHRFNRVFQNFLGVFGQAHHPLVIFLDDLQWADLATLKLLELLVTYQATPYLFVVGAYRDNEVDAVHPLMTMLDRLSKTAAVVKQVTLAPLRLEHITQLLTEALHSDATKVQPLAELVMQKTQGNPFFVNQFLKTLYHERLLTFDRATRQWHWDTQQLVTLNITANVVDLMMSKLRQLPQATQKSLRLAACIGNRFSLSLLALIGETTPTEVFQQLWPALQEELILPAVAADLSPESESHQVWSSHYKFLHDRIQQAAYALIPDEAKAQIHVRIGTLLLKHLTADEVEEQIFEIVHHLNFGLTQTEVSVERRTLAKLNVLAGKKARQSAAYAATLKYFEIATSCLEASAWQLEYDFTVEVYKSYAEAEFLNSHFDQATQLIMLLEEKVKTNLERADILLLWIVQKTVEAKYYEAIKIGRRAFQLLGLDFPAEETLPEHLQQAFTEVTTYLGQRDIASLVDAPVNQNVVYQIAIKILVALQAGTYIIGHLNLYRYVSVKPVAFSLQYGNMAESAKCYANYGSIVSSMLGDFATGYQFGMLAVAVSKRFQSLAYECRSDLLLGSWIHSWSKPIQGAKRYNLDGYHAGMASGEVQFASYNIFGYITNRWVEGSSLEEVQNCITEYLPTINQGKNDLTMDTVLGIQLAILLLTGQEEQVTRYGKVLSEPEYRQYCLASPLGYATYCTLRAQSLFILEQAEESLRQINSVKPILGSIFGFTVSFEYCFYHSLVLLARCENVTKQQREEDLTTVTTNQAQLHKWAKSCPENFLHRWSLVEAERARVSGSNFEAVELYDQAIELAGKHEFIQIRALANELAAKFWLQKGKGKIARIYLQEASHAYTIWGATRKVADLLKTYPFLFLQATTSTAITTQPSLQTTVYASGISTNTRMGQTTEQLLDLTTLMKVSQALSGEIWLNRLLERLMHTVIENAGAQQGWLVLKQHDTWVIEAQGSSHQESVTVLQGLPLAGQLPLSVINYVTRTKQPVVISNAQEENFYREDDYIRTHQVKSLLCLPIVHKQELIGMIYLENNLAEGIFTPDRLQLLSLLSSQMAISLENARFVVELEQARQAAESANAAKTAFLANVGHELRTPLNSILGYTHLLQRDSYLQAEQQQVLTALHRNSEHLLTLVSDILDIAKVQTAQVEIQLTDLNLGKFLTTLVEIVKEQAQQQGLTFRYELAAGLPIGILADEKRLRQILLHLLTNAVKFTQHGSITFQVQSTPLSSSVGEHHFQFLITDTGCGIAPADLERIFIPFEQVNHWLHKSAGAGLGLSLTKQLVELMGGTLAVSSQVGQGSTFTVQLNFAESAIWLSEEVSKLEELPSSPVVESVLPVKGPTAQRAKELYELTLMGDFFGILGLLAQLEQEDTELQPFVEQVRKLAKEYKDEQIEKLVQQFMAAE